MNCQKWAHPATCKNIEILEHRGTQLLGPGEGGQACGEHGAGRMLEPMQLVEALANSFQTQALSGKRVLITAGPTREAIDPVRYLSNRSSGKMGFALARAAQESGALVTLISGPVSLYAPEGIRTVHVESALDMHAAVFEEIEQSDIFISCAAVSDFRLHDPAKQKIKKHSDTLQITLVQNPDIAAEVANLTKKPFVVGFAAETHDLLKNAQEKLYRKKLDLIAANEVGTNQGFETDNNALTVLWDEGQVELPSCSKEKLARQLISIISDRYNQK
jgi:phosphopantothenoylcysteine decarboxylase/phosphopantothenate--cysteine ligase